MSALDLAQAAELYDCAECGDGEALRDGESCAYCGLATPVPPAHPSPGASGAPKPEPTRNRVEAAGVDGLTALVQGDAPSG